MKSGMSVGLLLVSVELFFMICILAFLPREIAGACFIGFAIGESLGASALRICGGIFTKIADIGSDLMKIVFKLPEDDPKNPGVIADCTGDNAGDSVGPTADGFETYGVTGVALIAFLALALVATPGVCGHADHLDLRHAHPDDPDLAGLLLHQRQLSATSRYGDKARTSTPEARSPPWCGSPRSSPSASRSSPATCCCRRLPGQRRAVVGAVGDHLLRHARRAR